MEDPTIYITDLKDTCLAVKKKEQDGEDPTQIINEFKKAIQDARLKSAKTPSYFIMTINMGGNAKRDDRVFLSSSIMRTCFSSIIFCQEYPGNFERDVVTNCGTSGYGCERSNLIKHDHTKSKNHAAILWLMEDFEGSTAGLKTTDSWDKSITEISKKVQFTTDLLQKIILVKLTCRKSSDDVLAVSWHGPHSNQGYTNVDKRNAFNGLITFLHEVCKEKNIPSFLIGGDFNLDTLSDDLEPGENVLKQSKQQPGEKTEEREAMKVSVASYELSPRQEERATKKNYIPNKDNFVIFSKDNKIRVSWIRPFEIEDPTDSESTTSDLTEEAYENVKSEMANSKVTQVEQALDHDPIIGVLQFLSGPAETRNEEEVEIKQDLLPVFEEKLTLGEK